MTQRLWDHISSRQFQVNLLTADLAAFRLEAFRLAWVALYSFTPTATLIAARALLLGSIRSSSSSSGGGVAGASGGGGEAWRGGMRDGSLTLERRLLSISILPILAFSFLYVITEVNYDFIWKPLF